MKKESEEERKMKVGAWMDGECVDEAGEEETRKVEGGQLVRNHHPSALQKPFSCFVLFFLYLKKKNAYSCSW